MEAKADDIIQAIVIVSAIFTIVVLFVIAYVLYFNKRKAGLIEENMKMKREFQEQLLQSRIEVQEHTFQQIGKELHDNVGQLLSTSKMLLGLTERKLESPPDTLLTANATLGQAIQELRSLSKSLDKEWLEQFNFTENLEAEIKRINAGEKIKVIYSGLSFIPCPSDEQILLFRIVQEAIQNAIKHAHPLHISILTQLQERTISIRIKDDGGGFEWNEKNNGMGLINMKHRTALLKGCITWDSTPGKGTEVIIHVPANKEMI